MHQLAFAFVATYRYLGAGTCLTICRIWGMHSPRIAVANDARAALQRLYICAFMITTSEPFAVFCHPLLADFTDQSWASCLCKCFGGANRKLCNLGMVCLFFLLVLSTAVSV